ncbi:MAG: FHA domain-containing protein [Actinomycetota bacterium]
MSTPIVTLTGSGPDVSLGETATSWPVGERLLIGRHGSCDLVLDVPRLSRRHAEIVERAGRFGIRDLDSSNGTTVNGTPIDDEVWLRSGDVIVLGGGVALRFHDPSATPIAPRIGRLDGVWIDPDSAAVWVDARLVEPPLSARQLHLLEVLLDADGELVERRRIVDEVWADVAADGVSDEAVAALIKRLRARLSATGRSGGMIDVVRGRGLRLVQPSSDA